MCLEPHDLAISKYYARRPKDLEFNRELARRGVTGKERLLALVDVTPIAEDVRARMRGDIERDFSS